MSAMEPRTGYVHVRDRTSVRIAEFATYALAHGFRILTWWVPTWWLVRLLAPVGGWIAAAVPSYRKRAADNLALVWPDMPAAERARLVRAAGREFTALMIEYARLDRFVREVDVVVEGWDHYVAATEKGRGVVLVTAHFGNWETARLALQQRGHRSGIFYRAFNNRYLDRYAVDLISRMGRPVLQKGRAGMRGFIEALSSGETVMILIDQRRTGAPQLDFLGHPAETATVPAQIARRHGAEILTVSARRDWTARRFVVRFEPPIPGSSDLAVMAEANARIGRWVEAWPEQWFWFHRRWRSRAADGAAQANGPVGT